MRKVTVTVEVEIYMNVDDDADIETIIDEMDYSFSDTTTQATIEDHIITEQSYRVLDSG